MSASGCKEKGDELSGPRAGALYVHVPFCVAKCRYCDFYSLAGASDRAAGYVAAVERELSLRHGELAAPLSSVFLGGGTPTALGGPLLRRLLGAIQPLVAAGTEVSVEANPGTLDAAVVAALADGGVGRVSLGVQSFEAAELAALGRIHTAQQAERAVAALRGAGLANVSLDLIYGVPGQTVSSWRRSLRRATALGVKHLSCYGLSIEPGTPLAADVSAGRIAEMDEQSQRDCYDLAIEAATAGGLEHYEISNFARPHRRCRHNLTYWRNESYVGLGPGAASYVGGVRSKTAADLGAYVRALAAGEAPGGESERLEGRAAMAESLMLGLRLIEGVDRRRFARRFGTDPVTAFASSLARHVEQGAVEVTADRLRLSREALFVSDSVFVDLICGM